MYVKPDFNSKKAFREAVQNGDTVVIYEPKAFKDIQIPMNGICYVNGPETNISGIYMWHAEVQFKDGLIVRIK